MGMACFAERMGGSSDLTINYVNDNQAEETKSQLVLESYKDQLLHQNKHNILNFRTLQNSSLQSFYLSPNQPGQRSQEFFCSRSIHQEHRTSDQWPTIVKYHVSAGIYPKHVK
jgi:hypothetical protein